MIVSKVPATTIATLSTAACYLAVDGEYLVSSALDLTNPAHRETVPLMLGTTRDDGAAFISYPSNGENIKNSLNKSSLPPSITPSRLFPVPSWSNRTLDIFNTTARVATDGMFRCINQATAYAGFNNHIFPEALFYKLNCTYKCPAGRPTLPSVKRRLLPCFRTRPQPGILEVTFRGAVLYLWQCPAAGSPFPA